VAWFGASAMASPPAKVEVAYMEEPKQNAFTSNIQTTTGNVVSLSCPVPPSNPPAHLAFRRDGHYLSGTKDKPCYLNLLNLHNKEPGT